MCRLSVTAIITADLLYVRACAGNENVNREQDGISLKEINQKNISHRIDHATEEWSKKKMINLVDCYVVGEWPKNNLLSKFARDVLFFFKLKQTVSFMECLSGDKYVHILIMISELKAFINDNNFVS